MDGFDLYKLRPWWWWYYYLSYAAAKHTPAEGLMEELVFDAIEYEVKLDKELKRKLLDKYAASPTIKGTE